MITNYMIMETIIKVNPAELDLNLLNKIKTFIGGKNNVDVTISLLEFDPVYSDTLNYSIQQADEEIVSMTMEEFVAYSPKKEQ